MSSTINAIQHSHFNSRWKTFITVAALTTLTAVIGYAAYFDYKRRNDPTFRKRLRKEQKRAHRTASKASESAASGPSTEELRDALERVKDEKIPESAQEKEHYFMQNVSVGEQLCAQGEAFYLPAALSFYRALRVYPSPVELIIIYQKTVPEPVFKIVMEMTSLDVSVPLSATGTAPGRAGTVDKTGGGLSSNLAGRTGPPSETASQEWENLSDPGVRLP